jgi:hypothetical protein
MSLALVVLAIVVALVAIDAIGRLDERRYRPPPPDPSASMRITVDLAGRDRDERSI